ncbi:MAG: squalene/phytoene synthase family protein [Albidovulum sp.]|nr:squalene/phytoene synthase family protein [Albidovulum sp.]MDE0531062.1 squalene/phytoene synthase family protein [Albidovulum sp.]
MISDRVQDLVRRGDPDRYFSSRAAPPELRPRLWSLYAFNLEVSRAPWAVSEPGLAAARLQWWIDAIRQIEAGGPIPRYDVCEMLRDTVVSVALPTEPLIALIEAKRTEISGLRPELEPIRRYVDSTSSNLMWLAAVALGTPRECEGAVREFGWGTGIASLFRADPQMAGRGRALFRGRPELVRNLALAAISKIASARSSRREIPTRALAAMLAGWRADRSLRLAAEDPGNVERGELAESEFRRRATLSWRSLTGHW